ncbi:MAG: PucR family transcriptional regulator [Acidaminococcaceae bacterium]
MAQKTVTLNALLEIENFRDKLRLVNENANLDYQITHVTIMEGPDLYEWVTGGEFVLTTFYAFSKNPELQDAAFEKLAQKISAIGIKTQRFIETIPDSIIKIADKYGLPVFEVKREVKFRELVSTINQEIQNYQTNMLIEVEQHYQKLIKASLSSDDINTVLSVFGKQIRMNCFCLDYQYKLVASWSMPGAKKQDFEVWMNHLKSRLADGVDTAAGHIVDNLHVFDCYARGRLIGMLVVVYAGNLPEKYRLMCQQAASFISIKLWDQYETNKKALLKIWQEILSGEMTDEGEITDSLLRFGLSGNQSYKIVLISKQSSNATEIYQYLKNNINESIFIDEDKNIVLLCHQKEFSALQTKLAEYIKKLSHKTLIVGTPEITNIGDLKKYYELAENAVEGFKRLNMFGINSAESIIPYSIVLKARNTPECDYLRDKLLFPLLRYDRVYQSNLVETLCCTLMTDSLEHTAKKLNIHINTLRYRLRKVHEITGKNYFKRRDRIYLLMVASIQQLENFQITKFEKE